MRETMHPLDTASAPGAEQRQELIRYLNLKLEALGQPVSAATAEPYFLELARPLLRNCLVKDQMMGRHLCPADRRVQRYLDETLAETCPDGAPQLPGEHPRPRPGRPRATANFFTFVPSENITLIHPGAGP